MSETMRIKIRCQVSKPTFPSLVPQKGPNWPLDLKPSLPMGESNTLRYNINLTPHQQNPFSMHLPSYKSNTQYVQYIQYINFTLVFMFNTGLSFQVLVIQLLLGQVGLVSGDQMLLIWRCVVVGAVIAAAIVTPSTDPLTQMLLAGPLTGLYFGGAWTVKFIGR